LGTGIRREETHAHEEIAEVLRVREPIYRSCAALAIETAGRSPAEVVAEILRWVGPRGGESM
jgi:shikimate kinase